MKPTIPYLKKQIRDEKQSSKEYRKHGFPQIAKQETRHRHILENKLKQLERRTNK